MVKSNAERQREFRAKAKGKFRKLEVLLPCNEFSLLSGNATKQGLTKAAYINELLHGNAINGVDTALLPDNEQLHGNDNAIERLKSDNEYLNSELAAVKRLRTDKELRKEYGLLEAKVKELERVAALDAIILDDVRAERDSLLHGNGQKPSNHGYDGNAKGFKAALVSIVGNDNNVVSQQRKRAYAALNIVPLRNGKLSTDSERLAVYEWLKSENALPHKIIGGVFY